MRRFGSLVTSLGMLFVLSMQTGCTKRNDITSLPQLADKTFAVPTGTAADKLVLSRFPNAKFLYFNSVFDASMAVKAGKADAAAYDEPILRNIAAKSSGLALLPDMITVDQYAIAVGKQNHELKTTIDSVIADLKKNGTYDAMKQRWFPASGAPAAMPMASLESASGVLKLDTDPITEPFSFVDASQNVVGLDIELAQQIARTLGKKLEVVSMDFGAMVPALVAGKVDMIAACFTVTEERKKTVLFSEPYYTGGIAALVRKPGK